MTSFMDVVNNWGDLGRKIANPLKAHFGGTREGVTIGERLADWDGSAQGINEPGFRRAGMPPEVAQRLYEADMIQATGLIKAAFRGSDIARFHLKRAMQGGVREAMTISDFPHLFGDVIDRAVLANYLETPYTWNQVAYASEVNDFRPVKRFRIDGGTGLLSTLQSSIDPNPGQLTPLTMGAQYPEDSLADAQYTYQLFKQGKRMPFFWETFVNDDLNAIKDTPARFGRGARRTEEYFVTQLYAGNLTFFSNTNKNLVNAANAGGAFTTNDPALSITALQQAIVVMMNQLDTTGQPISVEAMTLVVPPALKAVAMNILSADYVWMADQGGTTNIYGTNTAAFAGQQLHALNWARNIVKLAVNYYLPIVDTTQGSTGWYLFADPSSGRPALEFGRLRGHTMPELFMKLPNSVAIGEGQMGPGPGVFPGTQNANPMEGDFDTDAVHYKIRHVLGGTTIDPIMAVFSKGTNT